ncbi:MAG: phosphopentomutase [Clostridia bacterium]|nr:phosphopentomutase [Clostridia bacterium]MBR3684653.1 phosphopentomutase [Clostridia bacterium]
MKRVFLIVLDSLGIGALPDARSFGDEDANTLRVVSSNPNCVVPNLERLGLFNIEGVVGGVDSPLGSYARLGELSLGKDTTIGHWEMAGIVSEKPLPTYPDGFPKEIIDEFEKQTGRKTLCNKPYSGTEVLKDYGKEHIETGALIVYTSADSVFQIAAHEDVVPVEELYRYSEIARAILVGEHGVGRIIARPFIGEHPYTRTANRHDFSIAPPKESMLDRLSGAGYDVISVGKIIDIFSGKGITESYRTKSNYDGMERTIALLDKDFDGLCFVNLVDFDMKFGHRNDVDGYAKALTEFDTQLGEFLSKMRSDDILIITADHGCDPVTVSTDHSREYVPMVIYGGGIQKGVDLQTRASFSDISATILEIFNVDKGATNGISFLSKVLEK